MKPKKCLSLITLCITAGLTLSSCGGAKSLVVPHAVSTVESIPFGQLNLKRDQFNIINTIQETASVQVKYSGSQITINDTDGTFRYQFSFNQNCWRLDKFSGVATLGYFENEYNKRDNEVPDGGEFARRVAISRIITAARDYNADGVIEPITTTTTDGTGSTITYTTTVKAKLIKIKAD